MELYSALLDNASSAVMAVGRNPGALAFLSECTMDTVLMPAVNLPNYREDFFLAKLPPSEHHKWSWNYATRTFFETPQTLLTEALRTASLLATAKMNAFMFVTERVNYMRYKVTTNVLFQEVVYMAKQLEAERFKASGYDESLVMELPYLAQYAEYANIPLRQAAEEIMLQAKLDHEFLAKTENMRLELTNKLKKTATVEEVNALLANARRQ